VEGDYVAKARRQRARQQPGSRSTRSRSLLFAAWAAYQRLPLSYTLVAVIGQRPDLHRVPRFAALPHSLVAQRNMERAKQNCSGESGSRVPVSARQARRQL